MEMLLDEQQNQYRDWLGLKNGMKILDVGCGTGEFTCYLGRMVSGCTFTGLDFDTGMLAAAEKRKAEDPQNHYVFTAGDALRLPYENETFDLTVSYTFLTSIREVTEAVSEMARVTKSGGLVAAVTGDSFEKTAGSAGYWPKAVIPKVNELAVLQARADLMYQALLPTEGKWTDPSVIPHLFSKAPLQEIRVRTADSFFSLSDGALSAEEKREYLDSYYRGCCTKLTRFREISASKDYLTETEYDRLLYLLQWMHDYLVCRLENNHIWSWNSHPMLLMTGRVPDEK
jgi:ubiquinone/menaquinone biosynthesis C-methylase UbiE